MSWHRVSAAPACRAGALVLLAGAALAPAAALAQRVTRPGGEGTAGVRPGGAGRPPDERLDRQRLVGRRQHEVGEPAAP